MSMIKRFGKKVKESVPEEYQQPQETVDFKPIEDNSYAKETKLETSEYEKSKDIAKNIDKMTEKYEETEIMKQKDYIETMIQRCEQTAIQSEQQLKYIQKQLDDSRKKINVLKVLKNEDLRFEVRWLVDRIGELKDKPNGLVKLENEIYGYIEDEINNGKK